MILLYDADCRFCRWAVVWVLDHDPHGAVAPTPIQSTSGQQLLADLGPEQRLDSVHLIAADGSRLSGGDAVAALLTTLPTTPNLARLTQLSPAATNAGYRFVATHRAQFSRALPSSWKQRADARLAPPTR